MRMLWLAVVVLAVSLGAGCSSTGGKCPFACHRQVLRHVVLFKFNATTTPEQVKQIENDFRALSKKVPGIASFEWGTNVSPENLSQGFTHCFFLTFRTAAARDTYLSYPAHKAFGASLKGRVEKVCVVDYWTQD